MCTYGIIVLTIVMFIGMIYELIYRMINPAIWYAGGIAMLACDYIQGDIEYVIEGVVTFIILFCTYFVLSIICKKIPDSIGGGIIKGILISGLALGRYSIIEIIVFSVMICVILLISNIKSKKKNTEEIPELPGKRLYHGSVFLFASIIITNIIVISIQSWWFN